MSFDKWAITSKDDGIEIAIAKPCLICGDTIGVKSVYAADVICDKCKAAVMKVREEIELLEEKEKTCSECVHDRISASEWPCINCINNARDYFEEERK